MLYTDEKINALSERADKPTTDGPYVNRSFVVGIRDDYEAALAAQAAEIDRLKGFLDANRNVSVGVQLYDAELFREKDAEIDRLKAASERSCAELLLLRDMEHERCREARQEADQLKAALAQTWQPVDEDNEELPDLRADDDRGIFVHEDGRGIEFFCEGGELEGYFQLPEGYAVCRKVQP